MLSNVEFQALEDTDPDRVYTIPGGSTISEMGISEYLQYKQEVESKRRAIKADYAACARKVSGLKETLLDRYEKLLNLVTQREQRDAERKESLDFQALQKARQQELEYKHKLMDEITELETLSSQANNDYQTKHTLLADFLGTNATILGAVEKAEAMDTGRSRRGIREQAHAQIVEAFGGFGAAAEQAQSEQAGSLREELQALRKYEETTDDLVERLRIKVESIDLLEESQIEMIDSQLSEQRRLAQKVRVLTHQVDRANTDIRNLTDKVQTEILEKLDDVTGNKYQNYTLCVVAFILVCVIMAGVYYAREQIRANNL